MFVLGVTRYNEPAAIFAETIAAVRSTTTHPVHRVIVDDNAASPLPDVDGFEVIRTETNVGCAGAWNIILDRAFRVHAHWTAIVLNGDCAVASDTFARMMSSDRRVVCALGFSCFRLDRAAWERVGTVDEAYHPAYWEDADYRRRLQLAGEPIEEWPVVEVSRPSFGRATYATGITHGWRPEAEHAGYQGMTGEKLAWFQRRWEANRDRYVAKWGGMPGEETFDTPFNQPRA